MAAWRQAIELALGEADVAALSAIARSRTEPANRVERALVCGPIAALDDRPRCGRGPTINAEAKAFSIRRLIPSVANI
jgi:hypothetical protein